PPSTPWSPSQHFNEDRNLPRTGNMKGLSGSRGQHHQLPLPHSPCGLVEFDRPHDIHGVHSSDIRHTYLLSPTDSCAMDYQHHQRYSPRSSIHSDCMMLSPTVLQPTGTADHISSSTFPRMHYGSQYYDSASRDDCATITTSATSAAAAASSFASHHAVSKSNRIPANLLDQFEKQLPVHRDGFHTLQYQRASASEQRSESPGRIRHLVHSVQKLFTKSHSLEGSSKMNGAKGEGGAHHHHSGHHSSKHGIKHSKSKERKHRSGSWWSSDDNLDSDGTFRTPGGMSRHHAGHCVSESVRPHFGDHSLKTSKSSNDVKCSACESLAMPPEGKFMKRSSWSTLTVSQAKEAYRKSSLNLDKSTVHHDLKSSLRASHYLQVGLEKVYDRVPIEELWYCMRKSGVAEKYVRVVQDMYERSRTVVSCAVGQTLEFKVEVGLCQGSALSPFLFAMVMDQLSEEVRQESPWTMMFADDIVICSESREQVEENLGSKAKPCSYVSGLFSQLCFGFSLSIVFFLSYIFNTICQAVGAAKCIEQQITKVDKIRKDEVRKALKRMKSGKAVGPDDIPVEVWKCLGEAAVELLTSLFNRVLESERMPEEWRRSVLVPIFKNKGDVQSCSNYSGIKLMSHTMKLWERVVEARLRKVVEICEQQYGFMPRKSKTDAIFALKILMEKYRDGQRELHCVFVDLEKAYDRVPREELWYCMRKSGVAEKHVRVVQDMYERSRTVVRCAVVMDQLSEEVRQESPWTMMFADDIVICSESREQVEENLERWRFALERRGIKVSRNFPGARPMSTLLPTQPCHLCTQVPQDEWSGYLGIEKDEEIPCRRMRSSSYVKAMGDDESGDSDISLKTSPQKSVRPDALVLKSSIHRPHIDSQSQGYHLQTSRDLRPHPGVSLDPVTSYHPPQYRSRNQSYMRAVSTLSQASCLSQVSVSRGRIKVRKRKEEEKLRTAIPVFVSQVSETEVNGQYESVCESVFSEVESQAMEALDLPGTFRTRSHSYLRAIQAGYSQDDDCLPSMTSSTVTSTLRSTTGKPPLDSKKREREGYDAMEGTSLLNEDMIEDDDGASSSAYQELERFERENAARSHHSTSSTVTAISVAPTSSPPIYRVPAPTPSIPEPHVPQAIQAFKESANMVAAFNMQWKEEIAAMRFELAELRRDVCNELKTFNSNFFNFTQCYNMWTLCREAATGSSTQSSERVSVGIQTGNNGPVRQNTVDVSVMCQPEPVPFNIFEVMNPPRIEITEGTPEGPTTSNSPTSPSSPFEGFKELSQS
ncbi:hypothetical protein QTP70_023704, partial [Hemibagrus guttatus]